MGRGVAIGWEESTKEEKVKEERGLSTYDKFKILNL